jgi:RNA polymerase sigma factor (sigma-70 family)
MVQAMNRNQIIEQLPGLRRYARALTGDAWAADDLVQDTLERACTKWALWQAGTDLRAWLFAVMHNLYLNQRRGLHSVQDHDPIDSQLPAADSGTASMLDLIGCLQRLSADHRAVLLLVSLQEMTYEETAQILHIPIGTVMSRLARARAQMRELMNETTRPPIDPQQTPALRRLK